jgi:2-phospho-L-lactate transferase/gluconeogenesis factor (CofD/UPF0052 family)
MTRVPYIAVPPGVTSRFRRSRLRVVLFSGGRGAGAIARQLIRHPAIDLTLAINGYDDGASTGEVRRFLGDCLGPSDFRKNASRLAAELATAPSELIALLDHRLPVGCMPALAHRILDAAGPASPAPEDADAGVVWQLSHPAGERGWVPAVAARLTAFTDELERARRPFAFSDCSIGNLVFAGSFLLSHRDFNAAVADYCALLRLPAGLIENVTTGTNAYLVGLDTHGELLASEEAMVDVTRRNRIDEIYLIDHPLTEDEQRQLAGLALEDRRAYFERHAAPVEINPRIVERLRQADLIIYAPGTQHSSLFPSYLTPGLSCAIADNLGAIKLLVTNIQQDAEIAGASATDIIDRALYYLREKGRKTIPIPCLMTHYLLNDPGCEPSSPYVPLGAIDVLEDPRLVRIGNYEDAITGHHDAAKILAPFIASLLGSDRAPRVAAYLHDAGSPNKLVQTLLEMVRGGVTDLPISLTVLHCGDPVDESFVAALPFAVRAVPVGKPLELLRSGDFEYVILFESSGMYRGEDIIVLASQLTAVRLDAAWGSRRLSVKDVEEAIRLRYRHRWPLGTVSHFGSHVLSFLYLLLYGRHISDTLSGARAVRARYLLELDVDPAHKLANHQLLTALLRDRAEILETPVRFFPISPDRVKRTSILDGLRAIVEILNRRIRPRRRTGASRRGDVSAADGTVAVG